MPEPFAHRTLCYCFPWSYPQGRDGLLWLPAELKLHLVVEICFSSTQIIAVLLRNFTGCILEGLYCMHVKFLRFTCVGNTLGNGHREQGSLIFTENRACRSETVPKFSKKIL